MAVLDREEGFDMRRSSSHTLKSLVDHQRGPLRLADLAVAKSSMATERRSLVAYHMLILDLQQIDVLQKIGVG